MVGAAKNPCWRLVGPWYRWARPGLPEDGRVSRPAIQKFAGDDFISGFIDHPQHSLKYDELLDVVNNYDLVSAGSSLAGKVGSFLTLNSKGEPAQSGELFRARLAPSNLRKLYQPTHDRHYLVTCELHCDLPGFPAVTREQVCQAGFVVRRRRSKLPPGMSAETVTAQAAIAQKLEADLLELLTLDGAANDPELSAALRANAAARQEVLAKNAGKADWNALLTARRAELDAERRRLQQWYDDHHVGVEIDGWFPLAQEGRSSKTYGEWKPLGDESGQRGDIMAGEQYYPLFPLIPDPRLVSHDAHGRSLYYGTVPTMSLQHDVSGRARFDDLTTYEVRCFVRAHHACPSRVGKLPDCNGALTWSLPSEPFRVAAPFDVLGASNRPITIKMPDLRELAAQAAMRPRGRFSPVRFVQPQQLAPKVKGGASQGGKIGGEAICSFSIPLITIIALFVLNLFLPIVVFIFNLWFLLVFRFCIPPQLAFSAGLDAALAVTPPGVDLDADFSIRLEGADFLVKAEELAKNLSQGVGKMEQRIMDSTGSTEAPNLDGFSNNALGPIDQSFADVSVLKPEGEGSGPPAVGSPLVYETHVTPVWPLAGGKA